MICKTCYQFFHFKCIFIYTLHYVNISCLFRLPVSPSMQKMNLHSISLSFLIAICAVLASTHIINPNPSIFLIKYLIHFSLTFFSSSPITSTVVAYNIGCHHHQHNRHHNKSKKVIPCEDFSPDFPQDTNTTAYICVDRNGCCNFTTVQAAIDAVPNFSLKRTIIWINTGIYL